MPFPPEEEEEEKLKAAARLKERRDRYAAAAGERLRGAGECQFSLLPYDELARVATAWHDACVEAILHSNYGLIDNLVRDQARVAAEQGFELSDLLGLLRLCRQVAIEKDGWNDDQFADADAIVDEALAGLRNQVPWTIPEGLSYLTGGGGAARERAPQGQQAGRADRERVQQQQKALHAAPKAAEPRGERRSHSRNKLHLPIRVRGMLAGDPVDEITRTENLAKGGLYFLSSNPYRKGARLQVMYPFWSMPGAINHEYPAEVVRVDERGEKRKGVAIKFLVGLGSQRT